MLRVASDEAPPLRGTRVAITADRRGHELRASFERLGATVAWGPTMRAVPPELDDLLVAETMSLIDVDPGWFAVSTGSGLRAWLDAAERAGQLDALNRFLGRTQVVARGAKSHGALRRIGIEPVFVSAKETMDDVCSWLENRLGPQDRLGVQVHGGEVIGTLDAFRARIKQVITVAPYRWTLPDDLGPARLVVHEIVRGEVDVLAETSAPSCRNLFAVAAGMGLQREAVEALRGAVCVAAVGPVTARAFEEVGIAVDVMPQRPRTADLLRAITHWAKTRAPATLRTLEDTIELVPSATAVRIGPSVIRMGKQEFAVLAAMVRRPGVVLRPEELALQAWGHRLPEDVTRVKHEVARVRRKLGVHAHRLETVRNVGYRYAPP